MSVLDLAAAETRVSASARAPATERSEARAAGRQRVASARAWCWTWNNPGEDAPFEYVMGQCFETQYHVRYCVFQLERGASGTLHYQGYTEFHKPVRMTWISTMFGGAHPHVEMRRGTPDEARNYCMKDSDDTSQRVEGPWEVGDFLAGGQGKRSDIAQLVELIESSTLPTRGVIVEQNLGAYIRYHRGIDAAMMFKQKQVRNLTAVVLLYGIPGTGKTHMVHNRELNELYSKPPMGFWFDGYDAHKALLLDDFKGAASHVSLQQILQVLDKYPIQLPVKGSHVWLNAERIYVTTNTHPMQWYDYSARAMEYEALVRRITTVVYFTGYQQHYTIANADARHIFFNQWQPAQAVEDAWNIRLAAAAVGPIENVLH